MIPALITSIRDSGRLVLFSVLVVAILASTIVSAPRAGADHGGDHPGFERDGTPYIMQNGQLYKVVPDAANPGEFTLELVSNASFGNSLGYVPVTNYLYGIKRSGSAHSFSFRVETYDGNADTVSSVTISAAAGSPAFPSDGSSHAGTALGDGRYIIATYAASVNGNADNLWEVDPVTGVTPVSPGPIGTRQTVHPSS